MDTCRRKKSRRSWRWSRLRSAAAFLQRGQWSTALSRNAPSRGVPTNMIEWKHGGLLLRSTARYTLAADGKREFIKENEDVPQDTGTDTWFEMTADMYMPLMLTPAV